MEASVFTNAVFWFRTLDSESDTSFTVGTLSKVVFA